jgi:hypothetical protein
MPIYLAIPNSPLKDNCVEIGLKLPFSALLFSGYQVLYFDTPNPIDNCLLPFPPKA